MNILVLYQDVQSGAKVATESIMTAYAGLYQKDSLTIYKQRSHPYSGLFSYIRNMVWSMWDFYALLQKTSKPDIIVSTLYTFALPWRLSSRRNVPAIFHIHGDQRFFTATTRRGGIAHIYHLAVGGTVSALQLHAAKSSTRLAFVSHAVCRNFLQSIGYSSGIHKSIVIPNGVDPVVFYPPETKKALKGRSRIGYVGRLDEKKGVHLLIDSLRFVSAPTRLSIVYPSPSDNYEKKYLLRLKTKSSGLPKRHVVRFLENISPMTTAYHELDFLVLPSTQEMFPLVLLEALSCNVLPIATNIGESGRILSRISNTLILDNITPQAIARTISRVIAQPRKKQNTYIKRGYIIASQYSWKNSAALLRKEALAIQRP